MGVRVKGLVSRVNDLGFRVQGEDFRAWGLGSMGFRVWGLGFGV